MTPAELERKVRQVDNDVQSIYELPHEIKTTQIRHDNRLDELGQDFDRVNERLDGHDQRFDGLDAKRDEVLTLLRER